MTFYGESLFALGILILLVTVGLAVLFALTQMIRSKRIKSRLAKEYGERPKR